MSVLENASGYTDARCFSYVDTLVWFLFLAGMRFWWGWGQFNQQESKKQNDWRVLRFKTNRSHYIYVLYIICKLHFCERIKKLLHHKVLSHSQVKSIKLLLLEYPHVTLCPGPWVDCYSSCVLPQGMYEILN